GGAPRARRKGSCRRRGGGGVEGRGGGGGGLGGRPPARPPAMSQLDVGVIGDPAPWMSATAIKPKSLAAILAEPPAGVQDRWFARLYLLKPLAIVSLALFWIANGLIALGAGPHTSPPQLSPACMHCPH